MFVRRKQVKGNTYYQLVRSSRENGNHRQQFLCHLGRYKSLEAAIAGERELAEDHERGASFWSEEAQDIKDYCLEEYAEEIEEIGGEFPSRRQAYLRWRAFWKEYNQEYWHPYDSWVHSQQRLPDSRRFLPEETNEWNERQQPWEARAAVEGTLLDLVYEHHNNREKADQYKKWAASNRTRLNRFLECKRRYF